MKKKKAIAWVSGIAVCIGCVLLANQFINKNKSMIEGEYIISMDQPFISWIFFSDGSLIIRDVEQYSFQQDEKGERILVLSDYQGSRNADLSYHVRKSGDKIQINISCADFNEEGDREVGNRELTFIEGKDGILTEKVFDGCYAGIHDFKLQFYSDGSCHWDYHYRYRASKDKMTIIGPTGSTEYRYQFSDNKKKLRLKSHGQGSEDEVTTYYLKH